MSNVTTSPISRNPKIHSGDPVFAGTRVPVVRLLEYLAAGYSLDGFLEGFPTVDREQAVQTLELIRAKLDDIFSECCWMSTWISGIGSTYRGTRSSRWSTRDARG